MQLACAVPNVDWGVSLTNFYLAEDVVRRPLALGDGTVALPDGPGLGVTVDEAAVARTKSIVARFGDPAAALADEAAGKVAAAMPAATTSKAAAIST